MRVFVDSSVLFSMCHSRTGAAREILKFALRDRVTLVVSDFVFRETERNLTLKVPDALTIFRFVATRSFWLRINPSPTQVKQALGVTKDPFDAPIVAAALFANVDALMSFDRKHLHTKEVEAHITAPVVTPESVLEALRTGAKIKAR